MLWNDSFAFCDRKYLIDRRDSDFLLQTAGPVYFNLFYFIVMAQTEVNSLV